MYIFNLVHTFKLMHTTLSRGKDLPIEIVAFRYFNFMCRKDLIHVFSRVKVTTIFKKKPHKILLSYQIHMWDKNGKKVQYKKGVYNGLVPQRQKSMFLE